MNEKELIAIFRRWLGSRVIKIGRGTIDLPWLLVYDHHSFFLI